MAKRSSVGDAHRVIGIALPHPSQSVTGKVSNEPGARRGADAMSQTVSPFLYCVPTVEYSLARFFVLRMPGTLSLPPYFHPVSTPKPKHPSSIHTHTHTYRLDSVGRPLAQSICIPRFEIGGARGGRRGGRNNNFL